MSDKPIRVQLSRRKGWRMPPNTVNVARPSKSGNPFRLGGHYKRGGGGIPRMGLSFVFTEACEGYQDASYTTIATRAQAVEWFRWYLSTWTPQRLAETRAALAGQSLACWCPLDQPCHADVLLEMANTKPDVTR